MLKTINEQVNKIRYNSEWEEAVFKSTKSTEEPPKRKHLRNLILRSWKVRGANDFFRELSNTNRPVLTKVIVAHKTLICVHNLIQEGHPACLVDSNRQRHLFESLVANYGNTRVAYAQIVTQYSTYMLKKLDFHQQRQEWLCDKEGQLDWEYFLERYPGGGDVEYVLQVVNDMQNLMSVAVQLMRMIMSGLALDQRVHVQGTNACVAHPLVPLITDTYTLYQTMQRLLQRAYDLWDDASDEQLDRLEGEVDRHYKIHDALRSTYGECAGIRYVTSLTTVPELPENPTKLRKPKGGDRREQRAREEEEARRRAQEEQWRLDEEARRRAQMEDEARRRAQMEAARLQAEQEAAQALLDAQRRAQQDAAVQALLQHLMDKIRRERDAHQAQSAACDQLADKWKNNAELLQTETQDLQKLLQQLLAENDALREKIAAEKRQHSAFVRALLERTLQQTQALIGQSIKVHEDPQSKGRSDAQGQQVADTAATVKRLVDGLASAKGDHGAIVKGLSGAPGLVQHMLETVKGATIALHDPNAQRTCAVAKMCADGVLGLCASACANQDFEGLLRLRQMLDALQVEGKKLQAEEEKQRLSAQEQAALQRAAQEAALQIKERLARLLEQLRQAQAGQNDLAVRAAMDAAQAITQATQGMGSLVLDEFARNSANMRYRRDADYHNTLRELCDRMCAALEQLVMCAIQVAMNPAAPQPWQALVDASELVRTSTLAFVEHVRSRGDGKGAASLEQAYRSVTAAIKALIDSVQSLQKSRLEQQQQQAGAFEEDRTEILEKRAEVHRLKAKVQRKRLSTDNLMAALGTAK